MSLLAIHLPCYAQAKVIGQFDELMQALLSQYRIPGGSLTVSKDGEVIYSNGFGYADLATRTPVTPRSLFRVASVSKPITAVATLKLIEQGRLSLSSRVYELLGDVQLPPGTRRNRDIDAITVEHLLNHSSGQALYNEANRITSPMQPPVSRQISQMFDISHPPPLPHVIGYMATRSLLNQPGRAYRYSNYGYALLGHVIKKVAGMSYEDYVTKNVFNPIGIHSARLGRTRSAQRAPQEVTYYDLDDAKPVRSVFDGGEVGTFPYAGRHHEGWGAAGAWIASTEDLVKFVNHIDGRNMPRLLRSSSIERMQQQPSFGTKKPNFWYGLGFRIQKKRQGAHWYHNGSSNVGAAAMLLRSADGFVWAALFNKRMPKGRNLYKEFNRRMWEIVRPLRW